MPLAQPDRGVCACGGAAGRTGAHDVRALACDLSLPRSGDAAVTLPLAIMTSGDTHAGTERLLAENGNFGMATGQITLMRQACD